MHHTGGQEAGDETIHGQTEEDGQHAVEISGEQDELEQIERVAGFTKEDERPPGEPGGEADLRMGAKV